MLTVVLLTPLVAGLYFKFPTAFAALVTMSVSVVATVAIDFATAHKGYGILNPIALGICVGVVTMAIVGPLTANRRSTSPV